VSDRPIEPSEIDDAPISADLDGDGQIDGYELALQEIGRLSEKLAEADAERDRLKSAGDIESVKARMLEPYVNKVFTFVAIYCGIVAVILFLAGMNIGFTLPETILAIISGSTAISVIGLIGLVITGLFGAKNGAR